MRNNVCLNMELIRHEIAPVFNIITISETWLKDHDNINDFLINGFQDPFILNRDSPGGGVLCWVADDIASKRLYEFELPGLEAIWLEIRINNNKFLLCNVYRSPSDNTIFW